MPKEIHEFDPKIFKERLNALMESRGCINYRVAADTNISAPTISKYRNELVTPDMACIVKLAQYFNVSIDWLVGANNESPFVSSEDADIALLYSLASPDDRKVVQVVLEKYRTAVSKSKSDHAENGVSQ